MLISEQIVRKGFLRIHEWQKVSRSLFEFLYQKNPMVTFVRLNTVIGDLFFKITNYLVSSAAISNSWADGFLAN